MPASIDPFCASCLAARLTPDAETRVQNQPPQWYYAMILVQLSYLGQLQAAQGGVTPVPSAVNVTSTLTTLAAASAGARKVQVFNNGSNDVTILEGGTPVAGTTGFVLKPGGYYESPSSHFAVVNAICGATLSSQVTVVTLGQ